MKLSKIDRQQCIREFEFSKNRLRVTQIKTMVAEFNRMCVDLGRQIEAEETRTRVSDPAHFAYSTLATAARERYARLQRSADALKVELARLRSEVDEADSQQIAA